MKKKIANLFIIMITCTSFFIACADYKGEQADTVSLYESLDKWMKKNRPDIPFIDSGIYYKIHFNHAESDELMPKDSSLVEIMITGKTIDSDYFLNSYKEISAQLGEYRPQVNYVPLRYCIDDYYSYSFTNKGINDIILKMKVGDSAEIFLSPDNSYGDIEDTIEQPTGFGGSILYSNGMISQFNVKLKKIDVNPRDTAIKHVEAYAKNILNINPKDSIQKGLYVKKINPISGGESLLGKDTVVQVRFTGYFLDGFIFDTNDKEIALEHNIYDITNKYDPLSLRLSDDEGVVSGVVVGFSLGLKELKPGEKATILMIPEWGYGKKGNYLSLFTIIQTYIPLIYDVEILTDDEN